MALIPLALSRISLTSANADLLAAFYENGIGFVRTARGRVDATPYGMPDSEALVVTLSLGEQLIELVQFDQPGAPYPVPCTSYDPWFQHMAIVVTDIDAALLRLNQRTTPIPISLHGPVTLPASAGGVTAIKLRDPEGHPFELLEFPAAPLSPIWSGMLAQNGFAIGIDHSAIVVSNTAVSAAFYAGLGLSFTSSSLNQGSTQDLLDAATGTLVAVTALSPPEAPPHLELLCYSAPTAPPALAIAPNDIAATRLVMQNNGPPASQGMLMDPDGHRVLLVGMLGWGQPA